MGLLVKKEPVPVPVRGIDCWPPWALSVTESVPLRVRGCVGVNVTLMVQVALTARLAGQLLVSAKSPMVLIPVMDTATLPLEERVTACEALVVLTVWFAKVNELGLRLAAGPVPVPVREMNCGALYASSLIWM